MPLCNLKRQVYSGGLTKATGRVTVNVLIRLPEEWRVPTAFVLLSVGTLFYEAAHGWFWQRAHDTAPVAGAIILLLLALLLRRHRFAWWVFVLVSGSGLVTWVQHAFGNQISTGWVVGGVL